MDEREQIRQNDAKFMDRIRKHNKWKCNAALPNNREAQRIAEWKPVRCELAPGHDGNHQGRNKFGVYQWWNMEKSPQLGVNHGKD